MEIKYVGRSSEEVQKMEEYLEELNKLFEVKGEGCYVINDVGATAKILPMSEDISIERRPGPDNNVHLDYVSKDKIELSIKANGKKYNYKIVFNRNCPK